ncbi:MAG TPA: enoyl-CoA hydratase-related protein [Solirubrobacterales bacterium]|nr:enoyl-CoA hydratase-related protein [Solirubrobacterales bacterium]
MALTEPRTLADGTLQLDFPRDAVARLTLSNPEKRNPLSHAVLDAIAETLPRLDHGIDVRCVVITGTGRAFSAGYDIGDIPEESFETDAEALVAHPFTAAMDAISAHPFPVVAALNGHCLGGGLELAVRCDMRLCAAEAKLGMPPAKLGLIYGHTGLERFIEAIGVPRTKELFLTGRNVSGSRAEAIGLVHEVHPAAEIEGVSLDLAAAIAANAPLSMRGNKHSIETLARFPRLSPKQEEELVELRRSCFSSEDFREGIRAFAEKRDPRWQGR